MNGFANITGNKSNGLWTNCFIPNSSIALHNGFLVKNVVKQRRAQFLSTHAQMQESIDHPRHRKILCWKTIPTPRCVKLFRSSFLLLRKFFSFRKKKGKCIQDKNYATTWRVEKSMKYWNICWFVPQENKWIEICVIVGIQSLILFPPKLAPVECPQVLGAKSNAQSWRHNAKQTTITFGKTIAMMQKCHMNGQKRLNFIEIPNPLDSYRFVFIVFPSDPDRR